MVDAASHGQRQTKTGDMPLAARLLQALQRHNELLHKQCCTMRSAIEAVAVANACARHAVEAASGPQLVQGQPLSRTAAAAQTSQAQVNQVVAAVLSPAHHQLNSEQASSSQSRGDQALELAVHQAQGQEGDSQATGSTNETMPDVGVWLGTLPAATTYELKPATAGPIAEARQRAPPTRAQLSHPNASSVQAPPRTVCAQAHGNSAVASSSAEQPARVEHFWQRVHNLRAVRHKLQAIVETAAQQAGLECSSTAVTASCVTQAQTDRLSAAAAQIVDTLQSSSAHPAASSLSRGSQQEQLHAACLIEASLQLERTARQVEQACQAGNASGCWLAAARQAVKLARARSEACSAHRSAIMSSLATCHAIPNAPPCTAHVACGHFA